MAQHKNDCLTCPLVEYTTCPLYDHAVLNKNLRGIVKCEMRGKIEFMVDSIKRDVRAARKIA